MANMLESYGLGFFEDSDETLMGLVGYAAKNGKTIPGYYGTPYIFMPAGNAEFWIGTEKDEGGTLHITDFHTHCAGNNVWELIASEIQLDQDSHSKTERILMFNSGMEAGGILPVDVINADVLPSFLKGEKVKLQVVAPCLDVKYFETEEDYADSLPADNRGKKWLIDDGALMPLSFLANHIVGNYEEGKKYENDCYVTFRATVKELHVGTFEMGGEKNNTFIRCVAETQFGPLEFHHSYNQVPEEMRDHIHVGAIISGVCIISADAAIDEYQNGVVKDYDHDFRLLRYTLERGEPERLRSVLTENAVYETETYDKAYIGPDEIIDRFDYVLKNHSGKYITHLAEITEQDDIDMKYPVGTKCIILADKESEDKYESIVFMEIDENGLICRIKVSTDSRYHFQIRVPERIKTPLDDFEIPGSVIELIVTRARFHGLIEAGLETDQIKADPDYYMHEQNAVRILEALQDDPQPDAKVAIENVLGYLFAKSIEKTINEGHAEDLSPSRLTASYSPYDAFRGELRSTPDVKLHKALLAEMDLGKEFGNDLWSYLKMTDADESAFTDTFKQAAVVVQRIGQLYAENGFFITHGGK